MIHTVERNEPQQENKLVEEETGLSLHWLTSSLLRRLIIVVKLQQHLVLL
jgi:hypothetical protein